MLDRKVTRRGGSTPRAQGWHDDDDEEVEHEHKAEHRLCDTDKGSNGGGRGGIRRAPLFPDDPDYDQGGAAPGLGEGYVDNTAGGESTQRTACAQARQAAVRPARKRRRGADADGNSSDDDVHITGNFSPRSAQCVREQLANAMRRAGVVAPLQQPAQPGAPDREVHAQAALEKSQRRQSARADGASADDDVCITANYSPRSAQRVRGAVAGPAASMQQPAQPAASDTPDAKARAGQLIAAALGPADTRFLKGTRAGDPVQQYEAAMSISMGLGRLGKVDYINPRLMAAHSEDVHRAYKEQMKVVHPRTPVHERTDSERDIVMALERGMECPHCGGDVVMETYAVATGVFKKVDGRVACPPCAGQNRKVFGRDLLCRWLTKVAAASGAVSPPPAPASGQARPQHPHGIGMAAAGSSGQMLGTTVLAMEAAQAKQGEQARQDKVEERRRKDRVRKQKVRQAERERLKTLEEDNARMTDALARGGAEY